MCGQLCKFDELLDNNIFSFPLHSMTKNHSCVCIHALTDSLTGSCIRLRMNKVMVSCTVFLRVYLLAQQCLCTVDCTLSS